MILQNNETMGIIDWNNIMAPFLVIFILIILIILMLFLYLKPFDYNYLIILTIFLFSLIIGVESMGYEYIPFNPWLSIFFILIQTIIFFISSIKVFENNMRGK